MPGDNSQLTTRKFRTIVYRAAKQAGRDFPWRHTTDPYSILVSEVMLQQTQAARVVPKYESFIRMFPNARTLAAAPLSSVLRLWSGLGYNRRAKLLKAAAQAVVYEHGGRFPRALSDLIKLPGVGQYTAKAVLTFAFNEPHPLIETNIRTVYIHHFFPVQGTVSDRELLPIIEATLDRAHPCRWFAALMDYGSVLKQEHKINERSAHYVKQTKFAGSNREIRGAIVRHLIKGAATAIVISKTTKHELGRVRVQLMELEREGMVRKMGHRYALAE